jgi:hypothetical protein
MVIFSDMRDCSKSTDPHCASKTAQRVTKADDKFVHSDFIIKLQHFLFWVLFVKIW